jgi:histidinol-phosphate aminotransferase
MNWKEAMPPAVRDMEFVEYATCREERPVEVDCSLGTNPVGAPDIFCQQFRGAALPDPCPYPGNDLPFREALSTYWGGSFSPDEVIPGTGSIGLIVSVARTFCAPGSIVLGAVPQFPDGPMHFQFSGADYRAVRLAPPLFRLEIDALLSAMKGDESMVYLDRPHNPTGQATPLVDLKPLADACDETGALLVVDEAYGDFIPREESAIQMKNRSVIVLRSFSKGRGLAGIRTGYAVVRDPEARRFMRKVAPPFSITSTALEMAVTSLGDEEFSAKSVEVTGSIKKEVLRAIEGTPGIICAETHPHVPIMLVTALTEGVNLYETLMAEGIRSEAGTCFEGLGQESARLRIPSPDKLEIFLRGWSRAFRD